MNVLSWKRLWKMVPVAVGVAAITPGALLAAPQPSEVQPTGSQNQQMHALFDTGTWRSSAGRIEGRITVHRDRISWNFTYTDLPDGVPSRAKIVADRRPWRDDKTVCCEKWGWAGGRYHPNSIFPHGYVDWDHTVGAHIYICPQGRECARVGYVPER